MGLQRPSARVRGRLIGCCLLVAGGCSGSSGSGPSLGSTSTSTSTSRGTEPTSGTAVDTTTGPGGPTTTGDSTSSETGGLDVPEVGELEPGELRPGGDTTVDEFGVGAFVQEAANLGLERRAAFEAGLQFFQLVWEVAPSTPELDGLGPTYNAVSCLECHARNGRGLAPIDEPGSPGILIRLSDADGSPDPLLGDQLQPRAIGSVPAEGTVQWSETVVETLDLGDSFVELRALLPAVTPSSLGPPSHESLASPRLSMQLVGMGLLEAIDDADIESWADPRDENGDGISGRVARLDEGVLGRFGWKSGQPTVRHQVAAAFAGDLGITSELHPDENCPPGQTACAQAPNGGSPELTTIRLDVTSAYVRLLGVPARRDGDAETVLRGKAVFHAVGCAACHRPSFVTGAAPEPELEDQLIWPYTDLLLHDLGPGLEQGGPEGDAEAAEWRTPPLWSLGLVETVNGSRRLLHDGRARSLAEAIAWHGGEAQATRDAYLELSATDRASLHAFVESL